MTSFQILATRTGLFNYVKLLARQKDLSGIHLPNMSMPKDFLKLPRRGNISARLYLFSMYPVMNLYGTASVLQNKFSARCHMCLCFALKFLEEPHI